MAWSPYSTPEQQQGPQGPQGPQQQRSFFRAQYDKQTRRMGQPQPQPGMQSPAGGPDQSKDLRFKGPATSPTGSDGRITQSSAPQPQQPPQQPPPSFQQAGQQWHQQMQQQAEKQPWFQGVSSGQGTPEQMQQAQQWQLQAEQQMNAQPWFQEMQQFKQQQNAAYQRQPQQPPPNIAQQAPEGVVGQQQARVAPSWTQLEQRPNQQNPTQNTTPGQTTNTGAQSVGQIDWTRWRGPESFGQTTDAQKAQNKEAIRADYERLTGNPNFWQTVRNGQTDIRNPNVVWVQAPGGTWGVMNRTDWEQQQRGGLSADVPNAAIYRAGDLGNEAFATYDPATFQANMPGQYQRTEFSQWAGPDQQQLDQQQQQLFQNMLANPHTMNANVVSAMRNQLREQQASALQGQNQAVSQRFASMGRLGGGLQQTAEAQNQQQAAKNLLAGNRDIMLAQAERNRADELAAAQGASAFQAGQMGRFSDAYRNTLSGQAAQAGENQYGQQDAWRRTDTDLATQQANAAQQHLGYQSRFGAQGAALQRALDQQGLNQAQARQAGDLWSGQAARALQERLGMADVGLRRDQLTQQGSQFDRELAERLRQFNATEGRHWTGMGLNAQDSAFMNLLNSGRR